MPPTEFRFSALIRFRGNAVALHHPQSRPSTLICELFRTQRPRESFVACPAVSIASFGTASAKRLGSPFNETRMSPDQRREARRKEQLDSEARTLEKNFTRDWRPGDVYAPHDLSAAEARKFRKRKRPTTDAFDALSMNPLDCYKVSYRKGIPQTC
jgi:hypothetical protein